MSFHTQFDPYQELLELRKFALAADQHIHSLLENQKQMAIAFNDLSDTINKLSIRVKYLEDINAITIEE